jgi:MGT family glycosyltransferase
LATAGLGCQRHPAPYDPPRSVAGAEEESKLARFLLVTMPITGHVGPGLPIARKLVERGHDVRWYTGARFAERIEATGARHVPFRAAPDFDDLNIDEAYPGRAGRKEIQQFRWDLKHVFTDAAPGQVADLTEILADEPADVLVSDFSVVGVPLLHLKGGPPYAAFGITAYAVASRDTAPFGPGLPPNASAFGRIRNRAMQTLFDRVILRDVLSHYNDIRISLGVPTTRQGLFSQPVSPFLFLQPTVPSFEYPRSDLAPQVHFIGPFLPDAPASFTPPSWWDELEAGRPVVHVTQGTSATDSDQLIVPTLQALADADVLVVAATGGKPVDTVKLDPLPANAHVEPFIPYHHLLGHVSVMVTNGGYGGVQAALAKGVPLVVAGASEDKPEIATRVAWSGAGINLKTKTPAPERVRAAVRQVLDESSFRERAGQLADEIAGYDAPTKAAELLERLAASGQPVTR